MNPQTYKPKNQLVSYLNLGLWEGDIKINAPEIKTPHLKWNGACIDHETFRQALAFLKWTCDEHKVEGQARFFYNSTTHKWKTVVLPQYIWSMGHTREIEDDDANPKHLELRDSVLEPILQAGFGEVGTIHHHGNGCAYQSTGDLQDELSRNGFHVTVGHMTTPTADFHARITLKGILYEMEDSMFNVSDFIPGMRTRKTEKNKSTYFSPEIAKFWLDLKDLPEFPAVWKTYLVGEKVQKQTTTVQTSYDRSPGRETRNTYTSDTARVKAKHLGEIPVFKDRRVSVWLIKHSPQGKFRIESLPRTPVLPVTTTATATENSKPFTAEELGRINHMSGVEFEEYLKILQEEKRISEPSTRESFKCLLRDLLGTFRDEQVMDNTLTGPELKVLFKSLQSITSRVIRHIDLVTAVMSREESAFDREEFPLILSEWIKVIIENVLDFHPNEWNYLFKMAVDSKEADHFDFYELMCEGLRDHTAFCTIDPIYSADGSVDPEIHLPGN